MRHTILNARSFVIPKRSLQRTLKDCRANGYDVEKKNGMYNVFCEGELILRALNGHRSYLVRYNTEYLQLQVNDVAI
jgi:hypothetical protein